MKFGTQKLSLKKRIAARASVKHVIPHNLDLKAPRGKDWLTNPQMAAYNRVYHEPVKDGARSWSAFNGVVSVYSSL